MGEATTSITETGSSSSHPGPPKGTPQANVDAEDLIEPIERARHPDESDDLSIKEISNSILPKGKIPTFGEPENDCGQFIPEAMFFCPDCYDTHQFRHNCLRYDCSEHGLHAVRRRAAGSKDAAGVAPQLDALRRYLNAYRNENQRYHHLVFRPHHDADHDFLLESDEPLKRAKELIRELLDELGIQGLVVYHPWRGDHEDDDADDMGQWRTRLGHGRDWHDDVRDELAHEPHFHIIGVGHQVDLSDVGDVYDETGWVIRRLLSDRGDGNVSIYDDRGMAARVTYALSHAMIYDTENGQRRLAAWMKGPDVHRVTPYDENKGRIQSKVYDAAQDTLGLKPPDMTCDTEVPNEVHLQDDVDDGLPPLERPSASSNPGDMTPGPIGGVTGPDVATSSSGAGWSSSGTHVDAVGAMASAPEELGDDRDEFDRSWTSSSSSTSSSSGAAVQDDVDDARQKCGGELQHISRAGEFLLDADRREPAPFDEDLETAYRSYVDVMRSKGLEIGEGRPKVPEHHDDPVDVDGPPPD